MKEELKKYKSILALERKKIYNLSCLLFSSTVLAIVLPLITVNLIDTITSSKNMKELIRYMAVYFIVSILNILFQSLLELYFSINEFDLTQTLKIKTIERMFLCGGSYFSEEKSGNLYTIVEDDTGKVAEFVYRTYQVMASFIQALAVIVVLIYLNWKMAVMVIVMIPFVVLLQNYYGKKLKNKAEDNRLDYGNNNSLTEEFVSNASAMILFGIKKSFLLKYKKSLDKLRSSFKKLMIMNELSNQSLELSTTIGLILVTGYGGYEVFSGKISIGILIVFIQYCSRFATPLERVIMLRVSFNLIKPSLSRISALWGHDENLGKRLQNEQICEIKIEDVCFGYKENKLILNNFNLNFYKGKKYLVCGKSGIGKSTIINLILGFWKVDSGKILINGCNLEELNSDELRSCISIVSQKTFFFHDSIYNNLLGDKDNCNEEQVWNILKKVEMYDDIKEMPDGLNTVIGDDAMTLSGGQRQRLAIARALLKKSDVFIFDEPTSALDEKTEQVIVNTIKNISNRIVIIVSHSSSFSSIVDTTYKVTKDAIIKL